jgi:hypothetical protein
MGATAVYFEVLFWHFHRVGDENVDNSGSRYLPYGPTINRPPSEYEVWVRNIKTQYLWLVTNDAVLIQILSSVEWEEWEMRIMYGESQMITKEAALTYFKAEGRLLGLTACSLVQVNAGLVEESVTVILNFDYRCARNVRPFCWNINCRLTSSRHMTSSGAIVVPTVPKMAPPAFIFIDYLNIQKFTKYSSLISKYFVVRLLCNQLISIERLHRSQSLYRLFFKMY